MEKRLRRKGSIRGGLAPSKRVTKKLISVIKSKK
jgi:hypothetical protein